MPVYCNKDKLPEDPFCKTPEEHSIQNCEIIGLDVETNTFLLQFIKRYKNYSELQKSNVIDIYDGSYFWEKVDGDDNINLIMNLNKAVREGWKVVSYNFEIKN